MKQQVNLLGLRKYSWTYWLMSSYRFCRERNLTIRAGYLCCLDHPWKYFTTALNHIRNECPYR